jgi:hypothetical protein
MQTIQEKLNKIQNEEEEKTIIFIRNQFGKHLTVLDISNKYLVKDAFEYFLVCLSNHFKNYNTFKTLIFENCLLTTPAVIKLLGSILKITKNHLITTFDIANNQIEFSDKLATKIFKFFENGAKSKGIRIILQGNIVTSPVAMNTLLDSNRNFKELSLYDTRLSPEALISLSDYIVKNKEIINLDLSYNPSAFNNSDVVHTFGISIGINNKIEYLNLSGNTPLHKDLILIKLLTGIASNTSLIELVLGNLSFKDKSVEIITKILFPIMPLMSLDLQSNLITAKGFDLLLSSLPEFVTSLDVSYNEFKTNNVLESLGTSFRTNRTLRKLNISYSIELQSLNLNALDYFCNGITENISLSEFWCEGIKIAEDPDEFCSKVGEAISNRKYSLTFKISAVNCFSESDNSTINSYQSSNNDFKFA